jgi:hypothetical protein
MIAIRRRDGAVILVAAVVILLTLLFVFIWLRVPGIEPSPFPTTIQSHKKPLVEEGNLLSTLSMNGDKFDPATLRSPSVRPTAT